MIRLNNLDEELINNLLSPVFSQETTEATYHYLGKVFSFISEEELGNEFYLLFETLKGYKQIKDELKAVPVLNKEVVIERVTNECYYVIKREKNKGFAELMLKVVGVGLDVQDDESVFQFQNILLDRLEKTLDRMIEINKSYEEGYAYFSNFISSYDRLLTHETGQILMLLGTGDMKEIQRLYKGWGNFLYNHKIYTANDSARLLSLISSFILNKTSIAQNKRVITLERIDEVDQLIEEYKEQGSPLFETDNVVLRDYAKLTPTDVTILTGERGIGKTTIAGSLIGEALAQNVNTAVYSPETSLAKLLFSFIMPSYIYNKYGFIVTPDQCAGLEEPYDFSENGLSKEKRKSLITLAREDLVASKCLTVIREREHIETFEDTMSTIIEERDIQLIVIDHSTDFDSYKPDQNYITAQLGAIAKKLKKKYKTMHQIILSHIGSEFTVPTEDKPIITSKIVAYSKDLEGAADNIIGMYKAKNGNIRLFGTKFRWAPAFPMYKSFELDREHGLFLYDNSDQYKTKSGDLDVKDEQNINTILKAQEQLSSEQLSDLDKLIEEDLADTIGFIADVDDDDDDEDDGDDLY